LIVRGARNSLEREIAIDSESRANIQRMLENRKLEFKGLEDDRQNFYADRASNVTIPALTLADST
jgi:hypothetical protein